EERANPNAVVRHDRDVGGFVVDAFAGRRYRRFAHQVGPDVESITPIPAVFGFRLGPPKVVPVGGIAKLGGSLGPGGPEISDRGNAHPVVSVGAKPDVGAGLVRVTVEGRM